MFTQNENSVINYSPSCRSKPIRPSFIFRTQIKMFLMKSESFLTLHRQQCNWNVSRLRSEIVKIGHVTSVVQTQENARILLVCKENKNNDSTVLLLLITSSAIINAFYIRTLPFFFSFFFKHKNSHITWGFLQCAVLITFLGLKRVSCIAVLSRM